MFCMAKAALIKFREGVSNETIAKALNSIRGILDIPAEGFDYDTVVENGQRYAKMTRRPFRWSDVVHDYNPQHGEPVFYVP